MGREDVKRALEAMVADEAVAAQMAAGDFSGVDGLDLTVDERLRVKDAAADVPEVDGFAMLLDFNIRGGKVVGDLSQQVRGNGTKGTKMGYS